MELYCDRAIFMKRMTLSRHCMEPNFIGSWLLEPIDICDELVHYFETNEQQQQQGVTTSGALLHHKNSIDITIKPKDILASNNSIFERYFNDLFCCYQDYVLQWPFLKTFATKLDIGHFNMQRYGPGQHFQKVHTERAGIDTLHRVFAFMTYLNDVDLNDGGSTYFSHYDIDIQPQKGLTLIWPAEWTHAHKGNLLTSNNKYIITGWLHFPSD